MKDSAVEAGEVSKAGAPRRGMTRGLSIMDFILRILAAILTFASAVAMGTSHERLPFVTQFVHFRAEFDDLPSFVFFVLANALISGYLVLSLVLSVFHIVRSTAVKSRILLLSLDTVCTGGDGSSDGGGCGGGGDRGDRTPREPKHQLVPYLPTIQQLLRAHFGFPHRLFHCRRHLHDSDPPLCCFYLQNLMHACFCE